MNVLKINSKKIIVLVTAIVIFTMSNLCKADEEKTSFAVAKPASTDYRTLHKTIKVDGLDIFYREAGPKGAPNILLLHGFPTSSQMFRNMIPTLSDNFHVVAPDYPSYGNSSMPSVDKYDYTFDNLAKAIDGFIQKMGIKKFSMYVFDYGAPVGFRIATMHPEMIQALIVQYGNAYDEGLREFWDPFKVYWKDRTEENAKPLKAYFEIDATKWQYTNGVRNVQVINPDILR